MWKICGFVLLAVHGVLSQDGQQCYNSYGASGVCKSVTSCPTSFQLNINPLSLFGGSQQGCRNFLGIGRVCCSNAYLNSGTTSIAPAPVVRPQASVTLAPSTPKTTVTTTARPIVQLECIGSDGKARPCDSSVATQSTPTTSGTTTTRSATIHTTARIILKNRPEGEPTFDKPVVLPTPETGCGLSDVQHVRIVGGVPAALHAWPWMALVGYEGSLGDVDFRCGGTLITDRHVLSAAHCILTTLSVVRLGEHDTTNQTESTHIDVPIYQYISHPAYDTFDGHSDLAILFMSKAVEFNDAVRPICLPSFEPLRSGDFTNYNPFIAGWGRTTEMGLEANVLQQLQIPILENAECVQLYRKINKVFSKKQFNDAVLCAGFLEGGKDSCQGDSGGPLMLPHVIGKKFHYFQIGIVSYGVGCARADIPGVYTKVATFVDWIIQQISVA